MRVSRLLRVGTGAGVCAAVVTTGIVSAPRAVGVGVGVTVGGEIVAVSTVQLWTVVGAVVAVGMARVLRDRRLFAVWSGAGAAVSLFWAASAADDGVTAFALVVAHLAAAAILIPSIADALPRGDRAAAVEAHPDPSSRFDSAWTRRR